MLNTVKSSARSSAKNLLKKFKTAVKKKAKKPDTDNLAMDFHPPVDPAHAEGHKKLKSLGSEIAQKRVGKNKPMNASSQNRISPADDIRRKERPIRRNGPIG